MIDGRGGSGCRRRAGTAGTRSQAQAELNLFARRPEDICRQQVTPASSLAARPARRAPGTGGGNSAGRGAFALTSEHRLILAVCTVAVPLPSPFVGEKWAQRAGAPDGGKGAVRPRRAETRDGWALQGKQGKRRGEEIFC